MLSKHLCGARQVSFTQEYDLFTLDLSEHNWIRYDFAQGAEEHV
jgi:hypothetical protein